MNSPSVRAALVFVALASFACGGTAGPSVTSDPSVFCGPGTVQIADECVPASGAGESSSGGSNNGNPGTSGASSSGGITGPGYSEDAGGFAGDAGDGGVSFVPPADAGPASGFAVDPAHDNAVLDASVASPLTPAWSVALGGTASYPVVFGSTAIVAANGGEPNVRALDLATGQVVWGPIVVGSTVMLAVDGSRLFALEGGGQLSAYDATSGTVLWSTQIDGQIDFWSPPVASGGLVYVDGLESGGTTYAIDETTGDVVWTADTFDGSFGTVAVAGGIVYEAEACDQVSAFDATSGALLWYHSTSCTGGGGAAPAAYGGMVWVRDTTVGNVILDSSGNVKGSFSASVIPSFHDGTVFYVTAGDGESTATLAAVDIETSVLKWQFQGDGALCTSAVIAGGGGQVFVGSSGGNLYELDEATGAQKSVSDGGVTCGTESMSMGLAAGRLLVPAGDSLVAY